MFNPKLNQWLNLKFSQDSHLLTWIEAFLIDRKAQNMAKGTLYFYTKKLKLFTDFCETQAVTQITQIDTNLIRQYLLFLESSGHNPGGCHQGYRTLKTFLLWWEREIEPDDWKNPIHKIKAPKLQIEPLEPVGLETVKTLIDTCKGHSFTDTRDKSIFLALLDSGLRATEFCEINLKDFNSVTGEILIRLGKGKKSRFVYLSRTTLKAIRQYLKKRTDNNPALWVTVQGESLTYWGLREILDRRSKLANIKSPTLHSFRRSFALNCLKNGMDIYTLQKLMGHSDLQVLRRYLKQTERDLQASHDKYSPVEGLK